MSPQEKRCTKYALVFGSLTRCTRPAGYGPDGRYCKAHADEVADRIIAEVRKEEADGTRE